MSKPITLLKPLRATLVSDDACTTIIKYTLPRPPAIVPPYQSKLNARPRSLSYVPSLAYFCLKVLLDFPDQVHTVGNARIHYEPASSSSSFDILTALIPSYRPSRTGHPLDLSCVDPRLWALLVQLYTPLPPAFRRYTLPLSDVHLPLLQRVPSTPDFALLTVLSLPGCEALTDDTIIELRELHGLCAFDASGTALGAWGVRRLSKTLVWANDEENGGTPERRGPWGLRVLSLRNCMNVEDAIFDCLAIFPLLSVVDLRGTRCLPYRCTHASPFHPCADSELYHPTPLCSALERLSSLTVKPDTLFSNCEPFILHVDSLHHKPETRIFDIPEIPRRDGRLIAQGRMDVFLPYKPSRRAMEEERIEIEESFYSQYKGEEDWDSSDDRGSTEDEDEQSDNSQESDDISSDEWSFEAPQVSPPHVPGNASGVAASASPHTLRTQEAIAAHEISWLTEERSALHFYAPKCLSDLPSLPSHTPRSLPTRCEPGTRPSISAISPASSPFTLFRTPPPWNALPSTPPLSSAVTLASRLSEAVDEIGSHKRKRVAGGELDEDILRAEEARKSARAREGVRSLMGMVQRRTAAGGETEGAIRTQASKIGRANPFLRGTQADPSPASSSRQTGQENQSKVTSSRAEPSAASPLVAAPSPVPKSSHMDRSSTFREPEGRVLKPISTLKVPSLPPSHVNLKSAPNKRPGGHKQSSGTQVMLPAVVRSTDVSESPINESEIKAPAKRESVMSKDTKLARTRGKGKAKEGHGGGFNWKRWSGS